MTERKGGPPPLSPGEPLDRQIIVRVSQRMKAALARYAGARKVAAVVRELIRAAIEEGK